uniref:LAGLIDADG endonuclease n=2 Tax=Monilinia laxa TaxID=61186 RepID=A0A7L8EY97_MONLA|nr:LAGLIDADG endonuclease [Monilinia laxa]QOE17489.1 LAGLIDADG endonuclease [Monilinia laxa]QYB19906.1 LAGLIDADG endonuclease [Monilinia laxa]QYB19991.1 LAGLIDADG endonuclease [Monilinia laxa]QYB20083.1 LAGLIDADG endonuclease [Monilinia laxa]QYB20234.1 LAGLIDADG endonuclease [Monilinia laxa]
MVNLKTSALSPTIELGAQWPPMGIEAVNPFELPLLNTVERANISVWDKIAVWVKVLLYEQNLTFYSTYLETLNQAINYPLLREVRDNLISNVITSSVIFFWANNNLIKDNSAVASLRSKENNHHHCTEELYKWFVGFSDAESMFSISPIINNKNTKIEGFSFKFKIGLHKDDLDALNYIKSKLDIGYVYAYKDTQTFIVSNKEGINKLIYIFDKYPLNTSKYLDYICFKKAFILYDEKEKLTEELISQILELKHEMNTKRLDFSMPINYQILISKSWLLGFIEGDGSFSLARNTMEPVFSIKLTEKQLPVLIKIKEYLGNNLGLDFYSIHKLKCSQIITISSEKAIGNSKSLVTLMIKNVHLLNNYLIPYLSCEVFRTKKGQDFIDLKIICNAIYNGAQFKEELKSLILKLSYTMNNYILSTYSGSVESFSEDEGYLLINATPSIEHLSDGRQRDIVTKKVIHRRSSSSVYEIILPSGVVLIKGNLSEAAKIVGIGFNTLKKRMYVERLEGYSVEYKGHKIKRIAVFYPLKS